jgi:glycosyltransferase involved in cell wall biosynthesis
MKICFVTTGDVSVMATMKRSTGMAESLIRLGNVVSIIALDCPANRERFSYECPNAKILYFSKASVTREQQQKKDLLHLEAPDLVYVASLGFRNWLHRFNINTPNTRCVVEHSELTSSIKNFSHSRRWAYRFLEFLCPFIYDGQVVASKYLYNHFLNSILTKGAEKILYSPYAFNKNILVLDKVKLRSLREEYKGQKVVLYMGTLRGNYGFFDLIEAAIILKKQNINLRLLVIGGGSHKDLGMAMVKKKKLDKVVKFLGYVQEEDLGMYFKIADVFVSPLYNTTQDWARCPGKLFMYYPFNRPIVTCRVGEALELLPDNEYFYNEGSASDMADKIQKGLDSNIVISRCDVSQHEWKARSQDLITWSQKL